MISKINKNALRQKRHLRVRGKVKGTPTQPRLSVYRSTSNIYAQIIDDTLGKTLAACSTIAKGLKFDGLNKTQSATQVGKELAKIALAKGIEQVVYDRGGYLYTGRVKALAEGAREAGLKL